MGWGDEIIVTGVARRLQEIQPLPVRVLDKHGKPRRHEIWAGNPRIAPPEFTGLVQTVVNGPGRRPYIERETADRWIWREWECPVGEIHLTAGEREFGARFPGRVILEPNIKPEASPNKDWGRARWNTLAAELRRRGVPVAQLGSPAAPRLDNVEWIRTGGFREAAAVLASSALAVLPEGGLHHAAAALGIRAVVVFGGFISPRQTGYSRHVNLFTGGQPCGMRIPCRHCAQAMSAIRPEDISRHVAALLAGKEVPSLD
ncbi:MAG: glycosyltransferase family 9 protein [Chthoniobacter sp.]